MKYIRIVHFILLILLSSNSHAQLHSEQNFHISDSEFSPLKSFYYRLTLRSVDVSDNKKLIEQYKFAISKFDDSKPSSPKIPKILHHIWLGDATLPALYSRNIEQCRELHPGWRYKLWTSKDIKSMPSSIQGLINASSSYHEQSDILRLAVLLEYGGIYLDADIKCLESFDDLTNRYAQIFSIDYAKRRVLNGLIAASPGSDLIDKALANLSDNFAQKFTNFFAHKFDYANPIKSFHRLAVNRTMMPLSEVILSYDKLGQDQDLLILPLSYCMHPFELTLGQRAKRFLGYYLGASDGVEFYDFAKCYHNASPSNSYVGFPRFEFTLGSSFNQYKPFLMGLLNFSKETKFYKYIYENNYPSIMPVGAKAVIPKIIHFLNDVPRNDKHWQALGANYELKHWDEKMVSDLLKRSGYGAIADKATANLIASLIILKNEGGIVIRDEILTPTINIDDLLYQYSLFLTLEPLINFSGEGELSLSTKIFAASKQNIFIEKLIAKIKHDLVSIKSDQQVMKILSEIIMENYPLDKKLFIFPASFFFSKNSQNSYAHYAKNLN